MAAWSVTDWQQYPCGQQVDYPDQSILQDTLQTLNRLPPLVDSTEIDQLRQHLVLAERGEAFILQGGDCAESFADCTQTVITNKLKILLQMSLILVHGLRKPIIRIGRIAGQYAKPRSKLMETIDDVSLPSYRGDIINQPAFTEAARTPNPKRMLEGYYYAAATLNYLRALIDGGFADLQHPENWDLTFVQHAIMAKDYAKLVGAIRDALAFVQTINGIKASSLHQIDFYTSHEALHLPYEQALTRQVNGRWYNLSTHLPWVGMRTADLHGAHIAYLAGLANPVGIKISSTVDIDWLGAIIDRLNPHNEVGKLILITRLGKENVNRCLPKLIEAIQQRRASVIWSCDPMHGNTQTTSQGYKTRHFDDILSELQQTFACHQAQGSHLAGVHFELTGDNVTECIGGARGLNEQDLQQAYKSLVDPRLNYEQSLEMAMRIAQLHRTTD
jgi:3-deoxy-7-phosphoheptulonate synthase